MNFARDVVDAAAPDRLALVELARDGSRREWTIGECADRSARLAGWLRAQGIDRGDVVLTLVGNRPAWVFAMVACFRIGAVVLPCTEQLRAKDLRRRLDAARPALVLADERGQTSIDFSVVNTATIVLHLESTKPPVTPPPKPRFERDSRSRG